MVRKVQQEDFNGAADIQQGKDQHYKQLTGSQRGKDRQTKTTAGAVGSGLTLSLQLPLPGTAAASKGRAPTAANTSTTNHTTQPLTLEHLKAETTRVIQDLNSTTDATYKELLSATVKAGEQALGALATKHYEAVSANLEQAKAAINQAHEQHKMACGEVRTTLEELLANITHASRDCQEAIAAEQINIEKEMQRLLKKARA